MPQELFPAHGPDVMHRDLGHEVYSQLVTEVDPRYVLGFLDKFVSNREGTHNRSVAIPVGGNVFGLSVDRDGMLQMAYRGDGVTDSFAIPVTEAREIARLTLQEQRRSLMGRGQAVQ